MLPTLQKYIFREMGKTFLLTAIGLTFVLSTCGGAVSIIPLQSLSAKQTLMLLGLVVPISAAFTLPIAALFSATITYGRLAADNEFTAVRSSGINIYVLFIPCLLLSLVSAVVTFVLFNFLIPGLMSTMRVVSRESIMEIMAHSLSSGEGIDSFKNYRIRAENVRAIELDAQLNSEVDALLLEGVVFIEFESGNDQEEGRPQLTGRNKIIRFGTSESAVIKFDLSGENPQIEASLENPTLLYPEREDAGSEHLRLGPYDFQSPLSPKPRPKHLSLPHLLDYRKRPEEAFPKVAQQLHKTKQSILAKLLSDHLVECFSTSDEGCRLVSSDAVVQIQAHDPEISLDYKRESAWLDVSDVRVVEDSGNERRQYESTKGRISLQFEHDRRSRVLVQLTEQVIVQDASNPSRAVEIRNIELGPFYLPQAVQERFASGLFEDAQLWNKKVKYSLGPEVERQRQKLRKERSKYLHQIFAEIHVRTVYSISVFVLAILGAALGIIYRGGQMLVAFGISFLPTLFVILMTILGKNIARGEGTLVIGLAIMWCGLLAVTLLDYVVFKRYLPR